MSERRKYRSDGEYMDELERQIEAKDAEIARLSNRCWVLAFLLYPTEDAPREAVAGDLGVTEPQTE